MSRLLGGDPDVLGAAGPAGRVIGVQVEVTIAIVCEALAMLLDVVAFAAATVAALPVCCLVAVTRHRLWSIQIVVRRSLVYVFAKLGVATRSAAVAKARDAGLGAGRL